MSPSRWSSEPQTVSPIHPASSVRTKVARCVPTRPAIGPARRLVASPATTAAPSRTCPAVTMTAAGDGRPPADDAGGEVGGEHAGGGREQRPAGDRRRVGVPRRGERDERDPRGPRGIGRRLQPRESQPRPRQRRVEGVQCPDDRRAEPPADVQGEVRPEQAAARPARRVRHGRAQDGAAPEEQRRGAVPARRPGTRWMDRRRIARSSRSKTSSPARTSAPPAPVSAMTSEVTPIAMLAVAAFQTRARRGSCRVTGVPSPGTRRRRTVRRR